LNGYIIQVGLTTFSDLPDEVEIGITGGRKADLDFFEAALEEEIEKRGLLFHRHGVHQRLVTIS
jgi:hypothetical protein